MSLPSPAEGISLAIALQPSPSLYLLERDSLAAKGGLLRGRRRCDGCAVAVVLDVFFLLRFFLLVLFVLRSFSTKRRTYQSMLEGVQAVPFSFKYFYLLPHFY